DETGIYLAEANGSETLSLTRDGRRYATATLLSTGKVLVWGGLDSTGKSLSEGVWFDPSTRSLSPAADIPIASRVGHTATVLTDGRVLVGGGWSATSGWMTNAEIWDPRAKQSTQSIPQSDVRAGAVAQLDADGRVSLARGRDQSGAIEDVSVF